MAQKSPDKYLEGLEAEAAHHEKYGNTARAKMVRDEIARHTGKRRKRPAKKTATKEPKETRG